MVWCGIGRELEYHDDANLHEFAEAGGQASGGAGFWAAARPGQERKGGREGYFLVTWWNNCSYHLAG